MENKSDVELEEMVKTATAELDRRRKARDANNDRRWNEYLVQHFPETQVGGTCRVKFCQFYNHGRGDDVSVELEFTPAQAIQGLKHCSPPPYRARFCKSFEDYELQVEFHSGFSDSWFSYRSEGGKGPLYPYECNRGRCNKHFPPEVLTLPWIGKLIHNPKEIHDLFLQMK